MRVRLGLLLVALVASGAGGSQALAQDDRAEIVVTDPRLTESSALVLSPRDDGLLYTVNDSGHPPLVYVVEQDSGDVVGTTLLEGVDGDVADPEALAVDGDTLLVADIGDNGRSRDDIGLYALPAPGPGEAAVTPRRYPLRYPDGPADAETLVVDPTTGQRWIATKGVFSGSLLRVPDELREDAENVLEPVPGLVLPALLTDGTVLPDGSAAVLRSYQRGYVYRLPGWELLADFALPRQELGESVAALPGGTELLAGSEGSPALVAQVSVPEAALRALEPRSSQDPTQQAPASDDEGGAAADGGDDGLSAGWLIAIGGGTVLVGAAVVLLALRLGRRR